MRVSSNKLLQKYAQPTSHDAVTLLSAQNLSDSNFPEAATSPGRRHGRASICAWPTRPSEADSAIPVRSSARPVTTTGSRVWGVPADGCPCIVGDGVWARNASGAKEPKTRKNLPTITTNLTMSILASFINTKEKFCIHQKPQTS